MKLNVSLYIPVYNGESTIESVLKSAFKLNPSPDEIIVINDGSSDNTSNILENYKDKINFLNIIIVAIISFAALILIIETFKFQISNFIPDIDFYLSSLYESLKDIYLFFKDLLK